MGKARLIQALLIVVASFPAPPADPHNPPDEAAQEWARFSERCVSDSLKLRSSDEADIGASYRDGCNVNYYWSAQDSAASLIELSVASSDFRGCDGGSLPPVDFWTADLSGLFSAAFNPAGCYAIVVQFLREGVSWGEWRFW